MPHIVMPGFSSSSGGGIRSGLDTKSILEKLVAVEKRPIDAARKKQELLNTKLNAFTSLREGLSALKSAVSPLRSLDAFQPKSASSSDPQVVTATATSDAVLGTSTVNQVLQMAKTHKLQSEAFASGTDAVGSGQLFIRVGEGDEVAVTIDPLHSSLFDVRDQINAARADVTASVMKLHENDYRLRIQANASGEANNITIDVADDVIHENPDISGTLSKLRYMPDGENGLTEIQSAQDATFEVDGTEFVRSTNTISDAIPGVTLTLLKETEPNADIAVNVSSNAASAKEPIEAFVSAYNKLAGDLRKTQEFNAGTQVKGPLLGDAVARRIADRLHTLMTGRVPGLSGEYTSVVHLGITSESDGTLKINSAALESALMKNPQDVARLFSAPAGVANQMFQYVSGLFDARGGDVSISENAIKENIARIDVEIQTQMKRVDAFEKKTRERFAKLEAVLERLEHSEGGLVGQISQLGSLLGSVQNRRRGR